MAVPTYAQPAKVSFPAERHDRATTTQVGPKPHTRHERRPLPQQPGGVSTQRLNLSTCIYDTSLTAALVLRLMASLEHGA
jgi:hypothetical protein